MSNAYLGGYQLALGKQRFPFVSRVFMKKNPNRKKRMVRYTGRLVGRQVGRKTDGRTNQDEITDLSTRNLFYMEISYCSCES